MRKSLLNMQTREQASQPVLCFDFISTNEWTNERTSKQQLTAEEKKNEETFWIINIFWSQVVITLYLLQEEKKLKRIS